MQQNQQFTPPLESEQAMQPWCQLLDGQLTEAEACQLLQSRSSQDPTLDQLLSLHQLLWQRMQAWPDTPPLPQPLFDCCGTGGDGSNSLNISTAVAVVVAAGGAAVVKHGGGAASSKSGSLNVLQALGVGLPTSVEQAAQQLTTNHISFLPAPLFHPSLKPLAPLRKTVGRPTIFNLLGPLLNPARPAFQLLGVYDATKLDLMARALQQLGVQRAWVVHGQDGLDELSLGAPNSVIEVTPTQLRPFVLDAGSLGLPPTPKQALAGGTPEQNAEAFKELLAGKAGAYRDAVCLNSAAALVICGIAKDLPSGLTAAYAALDSGAASRLLSQLRTSPLPT
ncbi:MAG: anthranilate phosphoribosyltransferase [Alphaproteobacteria bacterium]|nr:anthranilate phosphoribosyltransferase [Alphaproteobacteria bacterium]